MDNETALLEYAANEEFKVDLEEGVIRGVRLCGEKSRNNRLYSRNAMLDLVRLYENKAIRINHDEKGYLYTVGSVFNPRLDRIDNEIRGDVSINKGHPAYSQIMEDAQRRPHLLALSHEIPARGYKAHKDGEQLVVDRVYQVDAVAIVTDGGVNKGLFESKEEEAVQLTNAAELKEKFPAIYEEVVGLQQSQGNERLVEALQERDQARAKLAELELELAKINEAKELAARKEKILAKAQDLKVTCSEDLLEALLLLDDDERIYRILETCPKIKEDSNPEKEAEKPQQRSGLKSKTATYTTRADRFYKHTKN